VRIESYVGDFCLTGNVSEGFEPADTGLPASKCDIVGNPYDDSLPAAQRQSVAFANFLATLRRRTGGEIQVEIVDDVQPAPSGKYRPVIGGLAEELLKKNRPLDKGAITGGGTCVTTAQGWN